MMTTCPKCGFEQPKDRFCAKCGILMEAFTPHRISILEKLLGSTLFYGLLLVALFGSTTYFIYQHSQQDSGDLLAEARRPAPRVAETNSIPTAPNLMAQTNAAGVAENRPLPARPPNAPVVPPPPSGGSGFVAAGRPPPATATTLDGSDDSPRPPVNGATTGSSNKRQSVVEVLFLKVDRDYAEILSAEADNRLAVGRESAGVIPSFRARLESGLKQGLIESLASESRSVTVGQPVVFFQGGRDPDTGENIGFFVEVGLQRPNERGVEAKIDIRSVVPDYSQPEHRATAVNIDEGFVIPPNGAAFLGGLLKRPATALNVEQLRVISVLRPLTDPKFVRSSSEFVILIAPSLTEAIQNQ